MLKIDQGNLFEAIKDDTGYTVNFTIKYDSDNDDTVSYKLSNKECIEELNSVVGEPYIIQILTDDVNVSLLIGVSQEDGKSIYFELVDDGTKKVKLNTAKTYKINISADLSDYVTFDKIVSILEKDMTMSKGEENEYKSNSVKH